MEMSRQNESDGELVRESIQQISKKWHSQILYSLLDMNKASFKDIKDDIDGISNKVLSGSLKDLTEKDLIIKNDEKDGKVYKLSSKGREMSGILEEALKWGEKHVSDTHKFNLLVVEDDETQAKMYSRWLEDIHEVDTATKGAEALQKLNSDVDIIILDRNLPDMNASEIIDAAGGTLEDKHIIMLTAAEPDIDILDMDIQNYLTKPVSQEDLEEVIEDIANQNKRTEKAQRLESLKTKRKLLKDNRMESELEDEEKYVELQKKIENLEKQIG